MININDYLQEVAGNINTDEFWDMFFGFGFTTIPKLKHFETAFGDDGASYFERVKTLLNDFCDSIARCTTFEWCYKDWVWEIDHPKEYAEKRKKEEQEAEQRRKEGKSLDVADIFGVFFGEETAKEYKDRCSESDAWRDKMKSKIAKFGVEKVRQELAETFNEYLREILEELGVKRVEEIAAEITFDECYDKMDDSDDEIGVGDDLIKLAHFAQRLVLPKLTSED